MSKAGVGGGVDKALLKQLSGYPTALGMSGAVMIIMSLLPGIPMLPFMALGAGAGMLAFVIQKRTRLAAVAEAKQTAAADPAAGPAEEPISAALKIDDLKIELGYALLPLVNAPDGSDRLTEQIKALRRSLASEMGFVMPAVRILDNVQLEANAYIIKLKETDAGQGRIWPTQHMVMDPAGGQVQLPGLHTTEPTFGLPATWIDATLKEEAAIKGYTVVDAATVLATHLTETLKGNMSELLSYGEVQKLIKDLPKEQGELVKDIVPAQITVSGIQRVLQLLLAERISIRDLPTILEGIADGLAFSRNPVTLVEHVRTRLARQICAAEHLAERLPAADRAVGEVGAGLRRSARRPGRGAQPRDGALAPLRVHHPGARALRGCGARGRGAGAGHLAGGAAVRPLDRGAISHPDDGFVAVGDPSAGEVEDGGRDLAKRAPDVARQPRPVVERQRPAPQAGIARDRIVPVDAAQDRVFEFGVGELLRRADELLGAHPFAQVSPRTSVAQVTSQMRAVCPETPSPPACRPG